MTIISKISLEPDTLHTTQSLPISEPKAEERFKMKGKNLDHLESSGMRFRAVNASGSSLPTFEAISTGIEDVELYHRPSYSSGRQPEVLEDYNQILDHPELSSETLRCQILPSRMAVWVDKRYGIKLSALAAEVLCCEGIINSADLRIFNSADYVSDPLSGLAYATSTMVGQVLMGVADYPMAALQHCIPGGNSRSPTMRHRFSSFRHGQEDHEIFLWKRGVGRIVNVALKSPVTFTMALTRGFHNAPRLYNDTSVRPELEVTGVKSGLVTATREFSYGLYDGLTGFVLHPVNGARTEGAVGFVKGLGKGIGGVVLKPCAGACAVPGYSFLGVYKAIQGVSTNNKDLNKPADVRMEMLAQGIDEARVVGQNTREGIVKRWVALQSSLKNDK